MQHKGARNCSCGNMWKLPILGFDSHTRGEPGPAKDQLCEDLQGGRLNLCPHLDGPATEDWPRIFG